MRLSGELTYFATDGIHHAGLETVVELATVGADAEAGAHQRLVAVSRAASGREEVVAAVERVSEVEFAHHGIVDAALAEVGQPDVAPVGRRLHIFLEMLESKVVDIEERLTLRHSLPLGVGHLMLLNLNIVFAGEVAQRVPVGELLMLHDKIDGASPLSAAETLADTLGARHRKRRGALVVKRAEPHIVGPASAQVHEVAHHLHDVGSVDDTLYSLSVDSFHMQ